MEHENPSFIQWWLGIIVYVSIWSKYLVSQVDSGWLECLTNGSREQQFLFGYCVGILPFWFFMGFWFMVMEVLSDLYTLLFEKDRR
jgi:hypothetical protein